MKDEKHILKMLLKLFFTKGREKPSDDLISVWFEYLLPYNDNEIIYAIEKEIRSSNGFPVLGSIIQRIEPEIDYGFIATNEWNKIISAVCNGADRIIALPVDLKEMVKDCFGSFNPLKDMNRFESNQNCKQFLAYYKKIHTDIKRNNEIKEIENKINNLKIEGK